MERNMTNERSAIFFLLSFPFRKVTSIDREVNSNRYRTREGMPAAPSEKKMRERTEKGENRLKYLADVTRWEKGSKGERENK